MAHIVKYPRTKHVSGSRIQVGDEDLETVSFDNLRGKVLVVEEKVDGSNTGISFDPETLGLNVQSRGHFLRGGPREKQFNLLKRWASTHESALMDVLQDRYIVYGEWMFAKHSEFYDQLPHYWLEFDVLDREAGRFLSTLRRRELLRNLPIVPAPVVAVGYFSSFEEISTLIGRSLYKSPSWKENLHREVEKQGLDWDQVQSETDMSDLAEGLYVKVEDSDWVLDRCKIVRSSFTQHIASSDGHWMDRPIVQNSLAQGVDIFT